VAHGDEPELRIADQEPGPVLVQANHDASNDEPFLVTGG
jgi:hypothetical protein